MAATATDRETTTQRLVRHILSYHRAALPENALVVAKQCVLDWFAVTLAAREEPLVRILREQVGQTGTATLVGTSLRCSPGEAALVNGAASHALDYDDGHSFVGHPTVTVLPAVLATAELLGSSGSDLLRAFIVGVETSAAIGSLALPEHYDRGFHATATLGAFGAAAAVGFLHGLDEQQMAMALGLAGTQAAGLKSMFGTMAKALHAGKAAANGVLAANLAKGGFTANPDVLDAHQGFLETQGRARPSKDIHLLAHGTVIVDTLFKYHAACFYTHSTLDAIAYLRNAHRFASGDIASVNVHVTPVHLKACNIPAPQSGLEIKFSLSHLAALAVLGVDTAAIGTYSDETARRADICAVRELIQIHGDRSGETAAAVEIRLKSGESLSQHADVGVPVRDLQSQQVRLEGKYRSLTVPVLGEAAAQRLCNNIKHLDRANNILGILQ